MAVLPFIIVIKVGLTDIVVFLQDVELAPDFTLYFIFEFLEFELPINIVSSL